MEKSGPALPVLATRGVTKAFSRVVANRDISIQLFKGEIIAVLGENGAGKSTLMNVLFGLYAPSSGTVLMDGSPVRFASPRQAIARGIGMVHQHFMLVPTLTVTQNVILGHEPTVLGHIRYRRGRERVKELAARYGLAVDPDARLEDLPVGVQQRVEILKALYRDARVLILDEPTAVLTPGEVVELFGVLKRLAESGTSIIIITHKLEEVRSVSDRVYVLRRGQLAGERRTADTTPSELATLMVGREVVLSVQNPVSATMDGDAAAVLRVEALSARNSRGLPALRDLNLAVKAGEILGIAGVEGNGQNELCETILGLAKASQGRILFREQEVSAWSVRRRMEAGLAYIPQDRRGSGLVLPFSVQENLALGRSHRPPLSSRGFLRFGALREQAETLIRDYDIRTESPGAAAATLSGGNQQKIILAREFSRRPAFLLVSQPTRGLDVGAIEYVYRRILELRARGTAILLVSMELEELFALSDRLVVLHEGRAVFESPREKTNLYEVGEYMIRGTTERNPA